MPSRNLLLAFTAGVVVAGLSIFAAHAQAPAALTGQVSSVAEGPMEGVVVSAKRDGSTRHHLRGQRSAPASSASPRRSSSPAAIRSPFAPSATTSTARRRRMSPPAAPPTADVKLRPTRNLAKQLTNAEWLASFPGTDTQKKALLNCIGCHDLDRIVNLHSRCRRVRAGVRPHDRLLSRQHAAASAAAHRRCAPQPRRGGRREGDGGVSRLDQSQQG